MLGEESRRQADTLFSYSNLPLSLGIQHSEFSGSNGAKGNYVGTSNEGESECEAQSWQRTCEVTQRREKMGWPEASSVQVQVCCLLPTTAGAMDAMGVAAVAVAAANNVNVIKSMLKRYSKKEKCAEHKAACRSRS